MSDDDWESNDVVPVAANNKWDDEDNEDVADDWDASDEETPSPPTPKQKPKPKTTLAQKIAERKQKELEEQQAKLALASESELERKQRLAASVLESDMDNARALVGNFAITESNALDATNPKSRAELEDYAKLLSKKIATFENQLSYPNFVEILVRDLVASLSVDDTRKISSSLSAMINEKQKLLKDSKGKKKAKKAVANVAARGIDLTNYDDDDLDDGDFM